MQFQISGSYRNIMQFQISGSYRNIMQFQISSGRETGKEIPESSRSEFLVKFSANNFALSDAEDNTSGPLNRGGIADLSLFRTLLAIRQKSQEPSFWEVMDSFPSLSLRCHFFLPSCLKTSCQMC